jgi:hypothetical protein
MTDWLRSVIRTAVPGLWAGLVVWLTHLGLPQSILDAVSGLGGQLADLAALVVVYGFVRWVEPHIPDWLTRVLLGSARPPQYIPPASER